MSPQESVEVSLHLLKHCVPAWREFAAADPDGSFFHTPEFVRYRLAARPGSIDRGLALVKGDSLVGIAPLVQEGDTLLDGGEPAAWPLTPYPAAFLRRLLSLCDEWGVKRLGFRSHPGGTMSLVTQWNAEWSTQVVDLTASEADLWRGVRGSYHPIVNKLAKQGLTVSRCTGAEVVNECFALHTAAAGRQTRPLASWEEQARWVADGLAACFLAREADGTAVGFAFVSMWKGWAYYFSGAATRRNVQHAIQWQAIRDLKVLGATRYELGWTGHDLSEKGRGIAMFKSGWGGTPMPVYSLTEEL